MYFNKKHKKIVEESEDKYVYIGSYKSKKTTIDGKKSKSHIRVKCPYCNKEYDIRLDYFKNGGKCTNCCHSYENSFAYYIQQELKEPLNKYWDWEKNDLNPYHITKCSHKKVWIKCDKVDYHDGYLISICNFYNKNRCPQCAKMSGKIHPKDSFGQWLIDTYGNNAVEKYWSPKNTLDPFKITIQSHKKVWILCQDKNYHNDYGGYEITCANFYNGNRCPYCNTHHGKVHPKDSFGALYTEKAKYWSKNNDKSPFEVSPMSNKKYKFICEKCGNEFERRIDNLNRNDVGVFCKECNSSKLEQITKVFLDKHDIEYKREYAYSNLIGVGNKNLRFDFYLPQYNTLIECQGEQHKIWIEGWQTKKDFEDLQIHDKRKKDYCKKNNIELIEIWYYDVDNIEEILINKLNL